MGLSNIVILVAYAQYLNFTIKKGLVSKRLCITFQTSFIYLSIDIYIYIFIYDYCPNIDRKIDKMLLWMCACTPEIITLEIVNSFIN